MMRFPDLMRNIGIIIGLIFSTVALAAAEPSRISVIEGVAVKNGNRSEAIFYYENNWLAFRKEALRLGYIDSYDLIVSDDANDDAQIVLITNFSSQAQFDEIEDNFELLMQDAQLRLLNDVQPGEFRESVFVVTGENRGDGHRRAK